MAKKLGSLSAPWTWLAKSSEKRAADGRDVDPDFLEHLAGHLAANPAASGLARGFAALPRGKLERRVAAGLALDVLERGANPVAERFEPVARGLLLVVELKHGPLY